MSGELAAREAPLLGVRCSSVDELKLLISRAQIAQRVAEMGKQIAKDSVGEPVVFVGVLKGAAVFLTDLVRQVDVDATFDFIGVASYGNPRGPKQEKVWDSTGEVRLTKDVEQSLRGKNVILVEDILDTGLTLAFLKRLLLGHQPKSFRVAVLLDKSARRKLAVEADYVGFKIPDEFVVGYGLDYSEQYRNLPDIWTLPHVSALE
jgi:hypoxanthine phosphoribosyltransferase